MKDTTKIVEELGLCTDFRTFYDENKDHMITVSLSQMLKDLFEEKNIKKSDAIKRAEISEVYAYQIFSGARKPERNKLICLALGMELNIEETQKLLRCAGYSPLYVKLPSDSILLYGICKKLTVIEINEMLFDYGLETI